MALTVCFGLGKNKSRADVIGDPTRPMSKCQAQKK